MKKFTKASQLAQIIMRTSLIVSFISFLLLSLVQASEVKGQQGLDQQINIHLKNVSFNVFLKEIEQKTGVSFVYTNKEQVSKLVTVSGDRKSAREVLTPYLQINQLKLIENGNLAVF